MGIKGLGKFLSENASRSVRQLEIGSLMGRILAIDASMSLYQFMIAIRDTENYGNLTNEAGEVTSHISGFLSRVVRLLENGIKPVYVFDGKPTQLKSGELAKRKERKVLAELGLEAAKEEGDKEEIKKLMGRTVRVTKQHNDDVKNLLRILGVPVIEAPNEAEAQCARLASAGLVYATATEDADALTFGSPFLIRYLNFSDQKARGKPILSFDLKAALQDLDLSMDQFIDFCILCGCDYCDRIKGIGPNTAYKYIKQSGTIPAVLEKVDKSLVPADFNYEEARAFFKDPEVLKLEDIPKFSWGDTDDEALRKFLIEKHSFNPTRVEGYITRLQKAKNNSSQTRLEAFFGPSMLSGRPLSKAKAKAKTKSSWKRKAPVNDENKKRMKTAI